MTKIVALEEHMATEQLFEAWKESPSEAQEHPAALNGPYARQLLDVGDGRIEAMDDQGIDVQVLSVTQPGLHTLAAEQAVPLARSINDAIAAAVADHPDRFEGFAALPFAAPEAAANELRRAVEERGLKGAMVFGRTGARNADDSTNEPIWRAASELRTPLYLHPQQPQQPVKDVYYTGISTSADFALSTGAVGWHYETGMQLIRMIFSGVFDRNPGLRIIVGHWGEMMLFWESRFTMVQQLGSLPSVVDYLREHVYFTGSGDLSDRYLGWTKEIVGADHVLYATDYPFIDVGDGRARNFLETASLTTEEREQIGHRNWESLTKHLS